VQVVAIIGQKGGSGKATVALGLVVKATLSGKSVAIIDLDPQTTAANWSDRRQDDNPVIVYLVYLARFHV
jgi:chromosome partitioning protein